VAPDRGRVARAAQHHPAAPAALRARAQPGRERLNPVENVWALLRSNKLSNRAFESYDTILDACADAWNWPTAQPERITTIAS
jgi:transposase